MKGRTNELRIVLSKVNDKISLPTDAEFILSTEKEDSGSPVLALFKNKRALGTVMDLDCLFHVLAHD